MSGEIVNIIPGNTLEAIKSIPDKSIHVCIYSPPYWNKRQYVTPVYEGGDAECKHGRGLVCSKCGAKRVDNELGAEAVHDCYGWVTGNNCGECFVCHQRQVAVEVHRVLRDDGTLWINIGDTRSGSGGAGGDYGKKGLKDGQPKYKGSGKSSGLKPKDMAGIPQSLALALRADGWYWRSEIIWAKGVSFLKDYAGSCMPECLSPETNVFLRIKDTVSRVTIDSVSPGNEILTPNGWKTVIGVKETSKDNAIKFSAASVSSVLCSEEHLWPVSHDRRRVITHEKRTSDLIDTGFKDHLLHYCIEPWINGTERSINGYDADYELGWFLGIYAAEGGFGEARGHRCKFTIHAREVGIRDRISDIALRRFNSISSVVAKDNYVSVRFSSSDWHDIARAVVPGKCTSKKIDMFYILNSPREFRQGIWDGYIEGDGSIRPSGGITVSSASKELRDSAAILASSLGMITSKIQRTYTDKRTGNDSTVYILITPYLFHRKSKKASNAKQITIRKKEAVVGPHRMIDLEVDGGLFLIDDGLCTHNSATDRPTDSHEYILMFAKQPKYYFDMEAVKEDAAWDRWGAQTIGKEYRGINAVDMDTLDERRGSGRNLRTVWVINPGDNTQYEHYATYPAALIEPIVRASTSEAGCCPNCGAPWKRLLERIGDKGRKRGNFDAAQDVPGSPMDRGGHHNDGLARGVERITLGWQPTCKCNSTDDPVPCTVLDVFSGYGTTGVVAKREARSYTGIELNEKHVAASERRIAAVISKSDQLSMQIFLDEE